jgi:DNA repair photolyase
MSSHSLLFHRHTLPTTRQVAERVRDGGLAALADANRRADHATYQEVQCRSALNRVKGMPFGWALNPYRGCTHGCHYCFARRYHPHLELDAGDQFASVIFVKRNFVDVLERELDRPTWTRGEVALGTATDPYQPIEGHYRLTRGSLEVLARSRTPVGVVTKGPMVVRDKDVLAAVARAASCRVYMSVPTVDEDAWRTLEPGTAPPLQRLRAVRALSEAGVDVGVLMAPIVPGFTSSRSKIDRTIKAIADHGARFLGCNVMHLESGTRAHFLRVVDKEFPALTPRLERLYARKFAPEAYRKDVQAMVRMLQNRYGLGERQCDGEAADRSSPDHEGRQPEQIGFRW